MQIVQYGIFGLTAGAVYALLGLGLVVIYRGSGVINFGQGAVGMVCTYVYWNMHDSHNMPAAFALIVSLLVAAVIGAVVQLLVMRPLRDQSLLTRMLATLGLLITFSAAISLKYPQDDEVVSSFLPSRTLKIGTLLLSEQTLILVGIALGLALMLFPIYRYTHFGIATTAVSENRGRAASAGISPDYIATINWMVGSMLAAAAGILIAPITGLSVEGLTLLIIPALAVAVIGRFRSFPIVLGMAFAIGIGQSELQRYGGVNSSGFATALPFFVTLIYFMFSGRTLPSKGDLTIGLPRVGTGRIRVWAVLAAAAIGLFLIETVPVSWVEGLMAMIITGIVVLSIVVVTGYAGQLSLAQFALAGCGAWISARLASISGAPFGLCLLAALAAAIPIGLLIGLPALRTRRENLAIATLGMSVTLAALVFGSTTLNGGVAGTNVKSPSLFGIQLNTAVKPQPYAIFALICFVIVCVLVANLRRSASGRRMLAIRDSESAAASLGVSVISTKLYAFSLSSVIAALAGVLFAFETPLVSFSAYDPLASISVVGYAVIGGVGFNGAAPLVGSTLAPGAVGSNVASLFNSTVQNYLALAAGVLFILTLVLNPDGVLAVGISQFKSVTDKLSKLTAGTSLIRMAQRVGHVRMPWKGVSKTRERKSVVAQEAILKVDNLTVTFGGSKALDSVSVEVTGGEVLGLIGPNGAGKSTFIDAVTGFVSPDRGTISLNGTSLASLSARKRAKLGVARTFQSIELFDDMTLRENLLVASDRSTLLSSVLDFILPERNTYSHGARMAIEYFGLQDELEKYPRELSYGRRRIVSIARALAREPYILMLDEPAAGLSESERNELSQIIVDMAGSSGVGVLLVEHDVELVMRTCTNVVVLEFGQVIASGEPDAVRSNPAVVSAYLGNSPAVSSGLVSTEIASVNTESTKVVR